MPMVHDLKWLVFEFYNNLNYGRSHPVQRTVCSPYINLPIPNLCLNRFQCVLVRQSVAQVQSFVIYAVCLYAIHLKALLNLP